jgi:hypothetical protein
LKVKIIQSPSPPEEAVLHRAIGPLQPGKVPNRDGLLLPEDPHLSAVVEFEYFSTAPLSIQCFWGVDVHSFAQLKPSRTAPSKKKRPFKTVPENRDDTASSASALRSNKAWLTAGGLGLKRAHNKLRGHPQSKGNCEESSSSSSAGSDHYGIEMKDIPSSASGLSSFSPSPSSGCGKETTEINPLQVVVTFSSYCLFCILAQSLL